MLQAPQKLELLAREMEQQQLAWNAIGTVNWEEWPVRPTVCFRIAHDGDNLYLLYRVTEKTVRAMAAEDNGRVWEDSCCEFFCRFDEEGYYNFECNCAGTLLIGYGAGRGERQRADATILNKVERWTSIHDEKPFDEKPAPTEWLLALRFPKEAFFHHHLESLAGLKLRANFYKCGDKLSQPHFLSWNGIETPQPDFHRPEFFGQLNLED